MKKVLALILMLCMLCLPALAEGETKTVTDGLGREVTVAAAERLVSLTPSNTEILFALGLGDKIVGVDMNSNYPAEVAEIEIVGDYTGPNIEAIVAAKPDIVFASTKLQLDTITALENMGLTVVCVEPDSYAEIAEGIQIIADAAGADAAPVLDAMEKAHAEALAQVPARETPVKVYFALTFGEYGDYTAGPGTFIDELITMAGGVNVAGTSEHMWPTWSLEQLIIDDPDVILISDYMFDGSLVEQMKASDTYKNLRCVQEGRVYAINGDTCSRPAPRLNDALAEVIAALNDAAE